MLCFSSRAGLYWLKVYNVPQGTRASRGKPIVTCFPFPRREDQRVLPVKEYDDKHFVFLATALGTVQEDALSQFSQSAREGDHLGWRLDDGDHPDSAPRITEASTT